MSFIEPQITYTNSSQPPYWLPVVPQPIWLPTPPYWIPHQQPIWIPQPRPLPQYNWYPVNQQFWPPAPTTVPKLESDDLKPLEPLEPLEPLDPNIKNRNDFEI